MAYQLLLSHYVSYENTGNTDLLLLKLYPSLSYKQAQFMQFLVQREYFSIIRKVANVCKRDFNAVVDSLDDTA